MLDDGRCAPPRGARPCARRCRRTASLSPRTRAGPRWAHGLRPAGQGRGREWHGPASTLPIAHQGPRAVRRRAPQRGRRARPVALRWLSAARASRALSIPFIPPRRTLCSPTFPTPYSGGSLTRTWRTIYLPRLVGGRRLGVPARASARRTSRRRPPPRRCRHPAVIPVPVARGSHARLIRSRPRRPSPAGRCSRSRSRSSSGRPSRRPRCASRA